MNVTASSTSVLLFAQFHPKKEIGSNLLSRWGRIKGGGETWKITTNFLLRLQNNISVSFWCCLSLSLQDKDIIVTIYFRMSVPHSSAWLWLELRGIFLTLRVAGMGSMQALQLLFIYIIIERKILQLRTYFVLWSFLWLVVCALLCVTVVTYGFACSHFPAQLFLPPFFLNRCRPPKYYTYLFFFTVPCLVWS